MWLDLFDSISKFREKILPFIDAVGSALFGRRENALEMLRSMDLVS